MILGGRDCTRTSEEKRRAKIKEHVDDLTENSSLHGLSYIFDTRHSIRRIIWFLITVIAFCYSMHKVLFIGRKVDWMFCPLTFNQIKI